MKRLVCLMLCLLMLPLSALADRAYLIPDSNTRLLTEAELWEWDYESLGYIHNEIFARHGYNFEPGGPYDNYFRCMPWYTPNANPNNQQACYSRLSDLEWTNEHLVKEVRRTMRAMGTSNPGGKSVWDYFSTGFDTLQGFNYIELKAGQTLPVFSAPHSASWRGANGKAAISTSGMVWAAGWENGWLLVMYETNNGAVRVGYVDGSGIRGNVPVSKQLAFKPTVAITLSSVQLTDDPARRFSTIATLPAGTTVTYLSTFFNNYAWDYIETWAGGQLVRGFIPSGCLNIAQSEDEIGSK